MKFKIGDRARVIRSAYPELVGCEVVIAGIGRATQYADCDCEVDIPGHPSHSVTGLWSSKFKYLAPLTPPAQDEWADTKVREVTKPVYTEPERVKEKA